MFDVTARIAGEAYEGVVIEFEDTGVGIPANELEHIFDKLYQIRTSTSRSIKGTGLGLAIAKEVIDRHHGRIEVASTGVPGEGTTFHVWLPAEASV